MDWEKLFDDAEKKWELLSQKKFKKKRDLDVSEVMMDYTEKRLPDIKHYYFLCSFCDKFHSYKYINGEIRKESACKGCPLNDAGHNCQDPGSIYLKATKTGKKKHSRKVLELIRSLRPQYIK